MNRVALAAIVVIATAGTAAAHQTAVKYADVEVRGNDVAIEIRAQPVDLTRPLGLADDALPTVEQAVAGGPKVLAYVVGWLAIRNDTAPCAPSPATIARAAADARFISVRWTAHCDRPVDAVVFDLAGFFAVSRDHEMILLLTSPGVEPYPTTIGIDDSPLSLTLSGDHPSTTPGWIWEGVRTFYTGRDHVVFVLALLVVVVISRRGGDPAGAWQVRPPAAAIRTAAIVIGGFAIGHSLAVVAASAGWFHLPPRFIGAMIGLSIAYTAVENVLDPEVRGRGVLAGGFGLVHGLGIASAFAAALPPDGASAPRWALHLGLELGLLVFTAAAVTALILIARAAGADLYRRRWMPIASALIGVLGAIWVIVRGFG